MTPTLFYIQLKNTQIIAQFFMISKKLYYYHINFTVGKNVSEWASNNVISDYYFKVRKELCNG